MHKLSQRRYAVFAVLILGAIIAWFCFRRVTNLNLQRVGKSGAIPSEAIRGFVPVGMRNVVYGERIYRPAAYVSGEISQKDVIEWCDSKAIAIGPIPGGGRTVQATAGGQEAFPSVVLDGICNLDRDRIEVVYDRSSQKLYLYFRDPYLTEEKMK